jgi:hypothetical protein
MRPTENRGLASPCINTRGVVCPQRNYSKCMKTCLPMIEFQTQMMTEKNYLSSSSCEHGPDLPIYFQRDGVAYR